MEKFELQYSYIIEEDLKVNVCFKPLSDKICDYINTYKTYENLQLALKEIPIYKEEIKPMLYNEFQKMDNISKELKNQFEL